MKVTPQITADLEEYPELRKIVPTVLRPVVDLMGVHAIASLRRMRKVGVFDHPYVKDVVTPMNLPAVPQSVKASQYAVGKALLDYLEAIGVGGVSLEMSQDEALSVAELWTGPRKQPEPPAGDGDGDGLNPVPADGAAAPEKPAEPGKPAEPKPESTNQPEKEAPDGGNA